MAYDAVIFDNDGVLSTMTDQSVLARAVRAAFAALGVTDPDPADVEALCFGVTPETLSAVADRYGLAERALWLRRDLRSSLVQEREIWAGRKARYDDVRALSRIDLPMGVVSSNQHRTVRTVLEAFGLDGQFETVYGREMDPRSLQRKKPNPHYLHRAIEDLGAENPLFVGDSESDVEAAAAAGVDSAFLRREHRADTILSREPTTEIETLETLPGLVST